jgi:aryl-alcohol dehydrogenase-like predicted oxidoreductase
MGLAGGFGKQDDEYMIRSVLLALEKGVNVIDTARAYGRSEELVGKALNQWKGERPFLATKPVELEMTFYPGQLFNSLQQKLKQHFISADCLIIKSESVIGAWVQYLIAKS